MNKNKNISIKPSKGISIVIKNDFQPEVKQKKRRKYKKKINLEKMATIPSFIPQRDVSYIKPQYNMSSLNRSMIFPGVPQSLPQLPAPPQLPQILPPPQYPQLPAPPQPPVSFNLDSSFQKVLENMMMPMESGFKSNSYNFAENIDDDIMDTLPQAQQEKYIETKLKPQIEKEIKDITFENEDKKSEFVSKTVSIKTAKEYGTKHANKLIPFDPKYDGSEYYKSNYVSRLQEIINQDSIKTRGGTTENTAERKAKAKELLKAIGIEVKPSLNVVVPAYIPPPATPPRPKGKAIVSPMNKPSEIEEEKPAISLPPAASSKPPPPAEKGPPPPPPPPKPIEKPKTASSAKEDEKKLIEDGALPLSKEMKDVMKSEPTKPVAVAGWTVGLIENDDVLDYLQDVINKISEDEDFMKDLEKSRGSGRTKFYKKYLQVSALFKHNNVNKIRQQAWKMFLETNDKLKADFEGEPEPVKDIKKVDEEKLAKLAEMASAKGIGAKYDEENKKKEAEKKKKELEEAMKKQQEEDKKAELEKLRKAEDRKNKKNKK
jgi:hypothetical protein